MIKRIPASQLSAAMATPERDVGVPTRHVAGSMASMVAALAVGECTSKVQAVDPKLSLAEFMAQGATLKEQLRNRITPSVQQAKIRTSGSYSVEIGTMVTTGNNLYLVAVVNRTE